MRASEPHATRATFQVNPLPCYGQALADAALRVQCRDDLMVPRLTSAGHGPATLAIPLTPDAVAWAATAHAAAHLQHGQAAQSRQGLKPVQIALLALLEDARVEHALLRDCPGLRELWVPLHTVHHRNSHNGFDALLARLSLSLLDPTYRDPHPWIARVRAHLLDADGLQWRVDSFQGLRALASVLGHDIGQMRLPFDSRTYRDAAPYRDDNQHLWVPDPVEQPDETCPPPEPPPASPASLLAAQPPEGQTVWYPEWDARIGRMRPNWCRVVVRDTAPTAARCVPPPAARRLARGLVLQHAGQRVPAGRSEDGQHLHPMAAVDAHVDRLRGLTPDWRVFRGERPTPQPLAVWVLLDTSQSMQGHAADMHALAWSAVAALDLLGHRTALWTLSSEGREHVGMNCLKNWAEGLSPLDANGVPCGGSSRLGTGVRHGLAEHARDARTRPGWRRVVLVVTDGELHDIDVHDPAYLYGDLAHCRAEASNMQVGLRGLLNSPARATRFRSVLGADHCAVALSDRGLQGVLKALLSR